MSLHSLLAVAVMGLALWSQDPTLYPHIPDPVLGKDTRGLGLETFLGRGGVRVRKGSTGPHIISSELWQSISKKRKQAAIREYERDLADATVAAVATFVPDGAVSTQVAPFRY